MDELSTVAKPMRLSQFSLLTMLLLITIVGLSIVVVLQWREVGPLRAENRRMRKELGFLVVDDPTKSWAVSVRDPGAGDATSFRWRLYLPPGGQYKVCCYSGNLPAITSLHGQDWCDTVKKSCSGFSSQASELQGEFTLKARLVKEGDRWMMYVEPGGSAMVRQSSGDWLSGEVPGFDTNVGDQQDSYTPDQPIILMRMFKPVVTKQPNGQVTAVGSDGPGEGVALWVEQQPPASSKSASGSPK